MSHLEYHDDGHVVEIECADDLQLHDLQLSELDRSLDRLHALMPVTHLEYDSGNLWWQASDGRGWQQTIRHSTRGWEEGAYSSAGWFVDAELETNHAVAHHVIRLADEFRLQRMAVDW